MGKIRTAAELVIHDGAHRDFEWYWADNDTMPALDAYEDLAERDQDDFLASIIHWGDLPEGVRPLESRVNVEHHNPLIVAIKGGKHRFTGFREEQGSTWIVFGHYVKEGQKRDKPGNRAVEQAIKARKRYIERVAMGRYYERG